MVHHAAAVGRDVTLNHLRYGDELHVTPGRFEDLFLVQVPLAGTARVKVGERVVSNRTRRSLGSPTLPVDSHRGGRAVRLLRPRPLLADLRAAYQELPSQTLDRSPRIAVR